MCRPGQSVSAALRPAFALRCLWKWPLGALGRNAKSFAGPRAHALAVSRFPWLCVFMPGFGLHRPAPFLGGASEVRYDIAFPRLEQKAGEQRLHVIHNYMSIYIYIYIYICLYMEVGQLVQINAFGVDLMRLLLIRFGLLWGHLQPLYLDLPVA